MAGATEVEFLPKSKRCPHCYKEKSNSEFNFNIKSKDGLSSYCRECAHKSSRSNHLQRQFSITEAQYNLMLKSQENKCAICNQPETAKHQSGGIKNLAVDHDHKTFKIRGLLCMHCNQAIGKFKHNIKTLKQAILYLEK